MGLDRTLDKKLFQQNCELKRIAKTCAQELRQQLHMSTEAINPYTFQIPTVNNNNNRYVEFLYYGCYNKLVQIMNDYLAKPIDSMPDCFYTVATYGRVNMCGVIQEVLERKIPQFETHKQSRKTRLPI